MTLYKAGYVTLLGYPNAGKSTLANLLVREKFAIVSAKAQTTRRRVVGLVNSEEGQIVLVDPPGIVTSQKGMLNSFLKRELEEALISTDVIVALFHLDATDIEEIRTVKRVAQESRKPWIAVATKSDLNLEHRIGILRNELPDTLLLTISALKDPQVAREKILDAIYKVLPESPAPLYDSDLYTTQSMRELVGEILREKCFEETYHEVPYGLAVIVQSYKEHRERIHIDVEIWVSKRNHKGILIGNEGSRLDQIKKSAKHDIEKLVEKSVNLNVYVKLKERWIDNLLSLRELGYVTPD